ncbi:MAG: permease prefix domain 1-containing protein [Planctomycetota bacterium]
MSEHEFEAYLAQLADRLRLSAHQRQRIAGELRDHLEARLDDLTDQGLDRDTAIQQALQEFGDTHTLAHDIATPARRRRRLRTAKALATAAAAIALVATVAVMRPISFPGLEAETAPHVATNSNDIPAAANPQGRASVTTQYAIGFVPPVGPTSPEAQSAPFIAINSDGTPAAADTPGRARVGTQVIVQSRLITTTDHSLADAGLADVDLTRTPTPITDQATLNRLINASTIPAVVSPRVTHLAGGRAYLPLATSVNQPAGNAAMASEWLTLNTGIVLRLATEAFPDTQQLTMSFEVLTQWGEQFHDLAPPTAPRASGRWLGGRYEATWKPGQTLALELPVDPRTLEFDEFAAAQPDDRLILLVRVRALQVDAAGETRLWQEQR